MCLTTDMREIGKNYHFLPGTETSKEIRLISLKAPYVSCGIYTLESLLASSGNFVEVQGLCFQWPFLLPS